MKLSEYAWYWYKNYRMVKQAKATQSVFTGILKNHICPSALGSMELAAIRTNDVQIFLTEELLHGCQTHLRHLDKRGTGLAPRTVGRMRQILIAIFRQAEREGYISQNPAEWSEPIPVPWQDAPVFTPENQRKFLAATKNHRFHLAYVLLFFLGCRRSEILGLSWDAIDFRRSTLRIKQTLIMEKGQPMLKDRTKTKSSLRILPLPKEIKLMLQEHRQQQKEESKTPGYHNEHNLVFTNKDGTPHNPQYFSRNFKNAIKRLDFLPNSLHVHSTRHTWATNMIQCGIPITDAQHLGGWARPDILLNVYAHTVQEGQRKAMKKLFKELQ